MLIFDAEAETVAAPKLEGSGTGNGGFWLADKFCVYAVVKVFE